MRRQRDLRPGVAWCSHEDLPGGPRLGKAVGSTPTCAHTRHCGAPPHLAPRSTYAAPGALTHMTLWSTLTLGTREHLCSPGSTLALGTGEHSHIGHRGARTCRAPGSTYTALGSTHMWHCGAPSHLAPGNTHTPGTWEHLHSLGEHSRTWHQGALTHRAHTGEHSHTQTWEHSLTQHWEAITHRAPGSTYTQHLGALTHMALGSTHTEHQGAHTQGTREHSHTGHQGTIPDMEPGSTPTHNTGSTHTRSEHPDPHHHHHHHQQHSTWDLHPGGADPASRPPHTRHLFTNSPRIMAPFPSSRFPHQFGNEARTEIL